MPELGDPRRLAAAGRGLSAGVRGFTGGVHLSLGAFAAVAGECR